MKRINTDKGFIVYRASAEEVARLGGYGVCDHCNEFALSGYLIPVLNHYLCEKCFDEWIKESTYYPEDVEIENRTAEYYENLIPVEKYVIKVKFFKNGEPSGREYTYFSYEDVHVGDEVVIRKDDEGTTNGIVTAIDVPYSEIAQYANKAKAIWSKVPVKVLAEEA